MLLFSSDRIHHPYRGEPGPVRCPAAAADAPSAPADRQEQHLTVAVTQLLAFLFPARASTWSPSEAVLVYQHLIVLQTLTRHLPATLAFIQRQFTEEFRWVSQFTEEFSQVGLTVHRDRGHVGPTVHRNRDQVGLTVHRDRDQAGLTVHREEFRWVFHRDRDQVGLTVYRNRDQFGLTVYRHQDQVGLTELTESSSDRAYIEIPCLAYMWFYEWFVSQVVLSLLHCVTQRPR